METPPTLPKTLSKIQRRVLGVLIEKAFTTAEVYPLTLKAVTSGCNQKNNRAPVTAYTENDCEDALNELRELGLAAVVHTETGRTERYRHYLRHVGKFTEPQIAILGELLLRGRQAAGELRGRASRMAPIDTLEQLRTELSSLQQQGYVRADGSLERRGVEVDHAFYEPREGQTMTPRGDAEDEPAPAARSAPPVAASQAAAGSSASAAMGGPAARAGAGVPVSHAAAFASSSAGHSSAVSSMDSVSAVSELSARLAQTEATCEELRNSHRELQAEVESLSADVIRLMDEVTTLKQSLGG